MPRLKYGFNQKFFIGSAVFMAALFVAISSFAETINYGYDDAQRLISVEYGDGTVVDYVYDNLGNRLQKTTTLSGAPANNPPNAGSLESFPRTTVAVFSPAQSRQIGIPTA